MKYLLYLLICLNTISAIAQTDDSLQIYSRFGNLTADQVKKSDASRLVDINEEDLAKALALEDIEKGMPFLLQKRKGIPSIDASEITFTSNYSVYFYVMRSNAPTKNIANAYNEVIFNFMLEKFGEEWISKIQTEVIGFIKWSEETRVNVKH